MLEPYRSLSDAHIGHGGEVSSTTWPESGDWWFHKGNQEVVTRKGPWIQGGYNRCLMHFTDEETDQEVKSQLVSGAANCLAQVSNSKAPAPSAMHC